MGLKFFISQKSEKWYFKEFNAPYLTWSKFERLTNTTEIYLLKVYFKAADWDAVGGEIWKYFFLNDNRLGTFSNQISKMSGFWVDIRHLQKPALKNFWMQLICRYEN